MKNLLILKLLQGVLTAAILYSVYQGGMWFADVIQAELNHAYNLQP